MTVVSSPWLEVPLRQGRTASTHRRANRRVTLRPKPWRRRLETVRFYVDGRPVARGFVGEARVEWSVFYDVTELYSIDDDTGAVVSHGYA